MMASVGPDYAAAKADCEVKLVPLKTAVETKIRKHSSWRRVRAINQNLSTYTGAGHDWAQDKYDDDTNHLRPYRDSDLR